MTKQRKRITLTKVLQLLRMFRYHSISQYFARKNNQLDHIHAHFAFITADIACYLSKIMKVNYSFTAHAQDIYLNLDNLPLKIKQASFIITCTKYNKEVLNKLTDNRYKEKIFHVYHGFNIKKWLNIDKKQQNNDEKINILSVARLVEKKGLIYLLKAVKILKERGEKFNCIIIGEGPLKKKLQRFIIENKLQDNVKIKPFFRQEKLKQYYINADVFILPCILAKNGDRDGLPNVILEAMASGTPVIATNVSAIGELIKNNENGVLIPPGDSILLADAFQYLKSDSDFYNKIADKGVDTIHNFFSIEKSTIELMKIFEAHKYTLPSKKINNF